MNILFLTHRLPYAPNRGDRIRAYFLLREMSRFASVSLFSLVHDDEEAAAAATMPFARIVRTARVSRVRNRLYGALRLPTRRPLTHSLLDAAGAHEALASLVADRAPDVVVAFCSGVARFALEPPLAGRPFVLDMVDVDSAKWQQLSRITPPPLRWIYRREAHTLRRFERAVTGQACTTLVVNDRERTYLQELSPLAPVAVIENGIDAASFAPPGPAPATASVVFTGVMNYGPNEEAVRWFADAVWPRVRAATPEARFLVVGSSPTRAVRMLAERDPSIDVLGHVASVQPYLWQSAVSVAPLRVAHGLQNKVLEALAAGLPVIVTPAVFDGLPQAARPGCVLARDANEFARALIEMLQQSPEERRVRAARAALADLTWPARLQPLEAILRRASARTPEDRKKLHGTGNIR